MNQTNAVTLSSLIGETLREEDILRQLKADPTNCRQYQELTPELQAEFLNYCTGNRGIKITSISPSRPSIPD